MRFILFPLLNITAVAFFSLLPRWLRHSYFFLGLKGSNMFIQAFIIPTINRARQS